VVLNMANSFSRGKTLA